MNPPYQGQDMSVELPLIRTVSCVRVGLVMINTEVPSIVARPPQATVMVGGACLR